MYLDLPANPNLDEAAMATFKETGPANALRAIRMWRDGAFHWCAITGWDVHGAVPAHIQAIEESGDGPALLVHGGPHGLRLGEIPGPDAHLAWSVDDAQQWGEAFLLVRPETDWVAG